MPRQKRAWSTETVTERWACIVAVAVVLYAPPIIIAFIAEHVAHLLHH